MICVDCGKEVEAVIHGSCAACFAKTTELMQVPEVVKLEICASCGARHVGAHWMDQEPDAPEEWVREEAVHEAIRIHEQVQGPLLELEETQKDERTFHVSVSMTGHVEEVPVAAAGRLQLRRTKGVCDRCSRIAGGYYAAIIQLRATERDVSAKELAKAHQLVAGDLTRQLDQGNRFAFLAKGGPIHGGWDYYIGDIDAARNVSRMLKDRLGAQVTETAKLVGRKEGEDVYRVTFLVRIHLFSSGDFALHKGRPIAVTAVHSRKVAALDLESHLRTRIAPDALHRLGGEEMIEEAVLVSRGPDGAQVMDPQTYKTVDLLVPDDWVEEPEVAVIRHEERLYWVPRPNKS